MGSTISSHSTYHCEGLDFCSDSPNKSDRVKKRRDKIEKLSADITEIYQYDDNVYKECQKTENDKECQKAKKILHDRMLKFNEDHPDFNKIITRFNETEKHKQEKKTSIETPDNKSFWHWKNVPYAQTRVT
jgi:hypothetical protein